MILEMLQILFLDCCCKLFRVRPTTTETRIARDHEAMMEAARFAAHDTMVKGFSGARTFTHHHDQARARHGLS